MLMQNLKKAFSTKNVLYSKMLLQYGLLQGWDEHILYLQAVNFSDMCI